MKRNILNIALMSVALAAAALTSCKKNELDPRKAGEGKKISFAISEANTRTEYDASDNLQINWKEGDKVRIYCAEAEYVTDAEYTVAQISKNTGKLVYNAEGLAWGGDDLIHNFYAVYPSSKDTVSVDENGIATFKVNHNQICTVTERPAEGSTGGHYSTAPDMTNAYMVASLSTAPVDEVALTFKPIMTTLEITVQGCAGTNDRTVALTGISIINKKASYPGVSEGVLKYDITNGAMASGSETATTETYYVGIKNGENTHVDLKGKESITLTIFIPPVMIDAQNTVTIQVHATGELKATIGGKTDINGKTTTVSPGSKVKFTLPNMPTEKSGNNWITPLDDNIYVQQLSIPGTHDSSAKNTSSYLGFTGNTQSKTLSEQWDMGIRAYDFRTAYRTSKKEMWMWHGFTYCDVSLKASLDTLVNKIKANPGEFAIIQFRNESETRPTGTTDKDNSKWESEMYNSLSGIDKADDNDNFKGIIQWKPELTIGECRGHIIILTRNAYQNIKKAGLVEDFPDNTRGTAKISSEGKSTDYLVQDFYKYTTDDGSAEKIRLVTDLYKDTKTFSDRTSTYYEKKAWALNHTSGYRGIKIIFDILIGSDEQYIRNAAYVNKPIYDTLMAETDFGPTGIVFMDYVGQRTYNGSDVYGDLLPQAIIDHNYKYRMLRAGE